jgi:hypothetical protein
VVIKEDVAQKVILVHAVLKVLKAHVVKKENVVIKEQLDITVVKEIAVHKVFQDRKDQRDLRVFKASVVFQENKAL